MYPQRTIMHVINSHINHKSERVKLDKIKINKLTRLQWAIYSNISGQASPPSRQLHSLQSLTVKSDYP